MKHVENIVIGEPLCEPAEIFALNADDWQNKEMELTIFTEERNLARLLVQLGIFPSVSEIKRNKPELMQTLNKPDFMELRPTKKTRIWILVGE